MGPPVELTFLKRFFTTTAGFCEVQSIRKLVGWLFSKLKMKKIEKSSTLIHDQAKKSRRHFLGIVHSTMNLS